MSEKARDSSKRSLVDRCIKDSDNNVVLFQFPNAPLILWILCTVLGSFLSGSLAVLLGFIAFGSLFTWCWLEITSGTTYLRKFLGLFILILSLANKVR